ncbi:hypothetical protein ACFZBE_39145 [Streptomyces sp. NPDC008061]|uniref:hypothetical protein n=1 Tax=Streptomyces sp. NPDC008061 TaxID=3364805 RepID=UPI0036EA4D19
MSPKDRFDLLDTTKYKQVAVVMGGWSQERDRSLASATAVLNALTELGVKTKTVALQDDRDALATDLRDCDVAMLAIAGRGAQDGALQGSWRHRASPTPVVVSWPRRSE